MSTKTADFSEDIFEKSGTDFAYNGLCMVNWLKKRR
jgi:hypothetical protein